jgi:hypothetical protein
MRTHPNLNIYYDDPRDATGCFDFVMDDSPCSCHAGM